MPRQTILSLKVVAVIETREDDTEFVFRKEVIKDVTQYKIMNTKLIDIIYELLKEALPDN